MPLRPITQKGMAEATALTRAGRLTEAVAEIQQALGGLSAHQPRKPLAQTLRDIARGGMPDVARPPPPAGDARFSAHHFRGPEGARDYMLFVPPGALAPMPVVVMLHGCTQSPADFAAGTRMNEHAGAQGVMVVYPAQPTGANANKCWNWFRPGDQARDAGEPAILAAILRQVLARPDADPSRVYVAGLSAGGAAALILAQEYPELFAAVGVHSGLAAGSATDVASAFAAMRNGAPGRTPRHRPPTIVFHGTADSTVTLSNARAVAQQGRSGTPMRTGGTTAGREWHCTTLRNAAGRSEGEVWLVEGAGHAWSGGSAAGSYADPSGPDASKAMLAFFLQHRLG